MPPEPAVRFQRTPNPDAAKFVVPGRGREGAPRSYGSAETARDEPVAAALLALDGVLEVFMVSDFITVTKAPTAQWSELVPRVEETIRAHL